MSEKMMYGCSLQGMRTALNETLLQLAEENEKIIVVDCETGTATNILSFRERFPDRFVELGVAEQHAVSFAFGLANVGYIPVLPLFGSFLTRRANDQIFIQVGYAQANIKMIGCYSGLTTPNTGATHQTINDLSVIRSIPGIVVLETCNEDELAQAIAAAVAHAGPVYIRMIRGDIAPYEDMPILPEKSFAIGKARILTEGNDVTIIATGLMVKRALEAAGTLMQEGISAEVINCSSLKPLDEQTILASVRKTGAVVTAENHSIIGGTGSAIAELLGEQHPVRMKRVGIQDVYGESGPMEDLLPKYGLTSGAIVHAVKKVRESK